MRHLLLVVTLAGFAAASAPSDEGVRIRYTDPTSRIWLEVDQDISVREHKSIATRTLFFDLTVSTQGATPEVGVTVQEAGGTYTAHGMEQRLRARHLTGKQFAMSIGDQGSTMTADEPSDSPVIHPGPPVSRGIPIAETLAEILPILPPDPVLEGTTWTTERTIHALEGWSWGTGVLASNHRVTRVERHGGRQIVSVSSEAQAALAPIDEHPGFTGELKRSFTWTFDATAGRLLSLSMEQESKGISPIQQGDIDVVQVTRVRLEPAERG